MMNTPRWISDLLGSLSDAIWPPRCEVCGRSLVDGEEFVCLQCLYAMPRTRMHSDSNSLIHQRLASPGVPIERTASWFYYVADTPYARLIQKAKYNSRPTLARFLGKKFAREIAKAGFFDGIDMLISIPLNRWKQLRRGYNQSEEICLGISEVTGIPVGDNLRALPHSTQTRKTAAERLLNVSGVYVADHPEELAGKHILLVDDVITTGATLLTAAKALQSASPGLRVSVLTIGATALR